MTTRHEIIAANGALLTVITTTDGAPAGDVILSVEVGWAPIVRGYPRPWRAE